MQRCGLLVPSFVREVVLLAAPFHMRMTVDEVIARGDLDLLTVLALGFAQSAGPKLGPPGLADFQGLSASGEG